MHHQWINGERRSWFRNQFDSYRSLVRRMIDERIGEHGQPELAESLWFETWVRALHAANQITFDTSREVGSWIASIADEVCLPAGNRSTQSGASP